MSYKNTLNLPKTSFSMRANLTEKEPGILKSWKEKSLYKKIKDSRKGKKRFVLHDGPPYANGHIHMGHVLNKILKDVVVKFYTMKEFDSPFVPGWDCHGLPVEHQLFKELKMSKYEIDQVKFRKKARNYALKFVEIQKKEFERLGIFGDWENPYLTLDPRYEAGIVRSFARLVKDGYIYKDLKPVNWCISCETALAEAEVEYEEHTSPSVYIKFKSKEKDAYFIIWTTTPWTLLGNVGIAIHPDMDYALLDVDGENWIMLEALVEATMKKFKKSFKVLKKVKGKTLEGVSCKHPFIDRDSKVVLAGYVSREEGTGCVHTAPGHGQEDYITGKRYDLPMIMPVDSKGIFDEGGAEFKGLNVFDANKKIIERLKKDKTLILTENITHSYPHCWRCKKPIIFRATEQYFVAIDHENLRKKMLEIIKNNVSWYPKFGQGRISAMVKERPDWCLSRQRYWGVPIVAFKCKHCKKTLLDDKVIEYVADIMEKEGSDAWFIKDAKDLLPPNTKCNSCGKEDLVKEMDIVDVWFESGVSHQSVLKENWKLGFPCDLYLEGSDQHRGWFQSSLITASAIDKKAPYKAVLTHGFVVDGEGKKMSKSLGNVISPQDLMKKYGADILRLWVASSNYQEDVRLSEEILTRLADAYRKIRNTFRYILGNINDFNFEKDRVDEKDLLEIDRWMLSRLAGLIEEAERHYRNYTFYKLFRLLHNFCVNEISSLYLDILKDRVYTFDKKSLERRSAQTVLYEILNALLKLFAPILVFTTEEAWQEFKKTKDSSVHESLWDWTEETLRKWKDEKLNEKWARLLELREEIMKVLEEKRTKEVIGSSLEAKVVLSSDNKSMASLIKENLSILPMLFITSQVEIGENLKDMSERLKVGISVEKAGGKKCNRCWNFSPTVGKDTKYKDICDRCANVVHTVENKGGTNNA